MSPDASALIGVSTHPKLGFGLYRVDVASGAALRLKPPRLPYYPSGLDLSPDGKTVFFRAYRDGESRLFAWNMDTDQEREVATFGEEEPFFALSPDGRHLALVVRDRQDTVTRIMPADGGTGREVYRARDLRGVSWSPDGRHLYFKLPIGRLKRISVDGGAVEDTGIEVPRAGGIGGFQIHPNGRRIFYVEFPLGPQIVVLDNFLRASNTAK
jgi:sugar lactone lactonase YvrE